ncbi:class I SAM-dependent methyltransferase [Halocatena halophila]|uniref:class I SAM-dependent methyltransferase n=1 Tax=Halocatena halophila TaxID=2814576 RepID=UPI002ED65CF5
MKKSIEEHAERFDDHATQYDDSQNSAEYMACVDHVCRHARADDAVILDLGTGTGAIALTLAESAAQVIGRDISEGMMDRAREKAAQQDIENVSFAHGSFREPNYDGPVDTVVSNFAMHHLSDEEKREAIATIASFNPQRFVLGDVMLFDVPDSDAEFFDPEVDDPATVGMLADALTDSGFSLTVVESISPQVGVLVAERSVGAE